jgi:hypothetical protein
VSLNAVLVDRASVVTRQATGVRVEGRTIRADVEAPQFKCRLEVNVAQDTPDPATGVPVVTRTTSLLYGLHDIEGNPVVLNAADRVRVVSRSMGMDELWDVAGDPQPIRKRRRLLGWQVDLRHVETPQEVY